LAKFLHSYRIIAEFILESQYNFLILIYRWKKNNWNRKSFWKHMRRILEYRGID